MDAKRIKRLVGRRTEGLRARVRRRSAFEDLDYIMSRGSIDAAKIVLISVVRDDGPRLAYWLRYYRQLGVDHFIIIDNGSTDDTMHHLCQLDEVTVYKTDVPFRNARAGMDWVNAVAERYCRGKWVLHVDSDEFLSYDRVEKKGLQPLVDLLERRGLKSLQCLLLDVYSRDRVEENVVESGSNPFEVCNLFDEGGYRYRYDRPIKTTWITGGVRARLFFGTDPVGSPALNKTPLVHWVGRPAFVQSAHRLVPTSFNAQSIRVGLTGVLLHQWFLALNAAKMMDVFNVEQHTPEYARYTGFGSVSPFQEGVGKAFLSSADLIAYKLASKIEWPQ